MHVLLLAALVLALAAQAAEARPAQLDRGFGRSGLVYPVGGAESTGHAVAILRTGQIVAAGTTREGAGESFAAVRLSRRGRLERRALVTFPGAPYAAAYDLELTRGGKRIVLAGVARDDTGSVRIALAALTPSLRVDPSFGTEGRVLGPAAGRDFGVTEMAVDRRGRILVSGTRGSDRIEVTRFTADGVIDPSFGTGGTFASPFRATVRAIAATRAGEVLVAGDPKPGGRRRPNVLFARLTERGTLASLDVRRVGRGGSATGPAAILPRPDGTAFVAATVSERPGRSRPALLRYGRGGRADRRFGRNGVRRLGRRRGAVSVIGLARGRGGRMVIGAQPGFASWGFYGLTRDGRPDRRFGERVAAQVGRHDGAVLNDFALHGRRIVGVGTDEIDDRIDYASYFVLAAFKG